ncbi:MAG: vanadium-dependent haloperoxidase [Blastocatellia bacterium]
MKQNHISVFSLIRLLPALCLLLTALVVSAQQPPDALTESLTGARDQVQGHSFTFPRQPEQIEPRAGRWRTWVLSSGSDFRPVRPSRDRSLQTRIELRQLHTLAAARNQAALDTIWYWDAGSPGYRWNELAISAWQAGGLSGPRSARLNALLNVAIYDATIAAWDAKYIYNRPRPAELDATLRPALATPHSPSYPSEHAVAAGAAAAILGYIFPADAAMYNNKAKEAADSRVLAGVNFQSDINAGLELGRLVAEQVIARARMDGSDAVFTGTIPTGPCNWRGTTPNEPTAGTWRTWVLSSGSEVRPGPPPPCGSAQFATELADVKNFARTFNTNTRAFIWQGNPQPLPAISYWLTQLGQKLGEYRQDQNAPRAARAYALVSVAGYDGGIAGWDAKYAYWFIRPSQFDPAITTLFPNPGHPSYPSAHSSFSFPQAEVLMYLFPREAAFFRAQAVEAGESRIWAGIHYRSDIVAGEAIGKAVAEKVIARARADGSQ